MAVAALLAISAANAADEDRPRVHRLIRSYDWANGFPWSYAVSVEQDRRGFLWLNTASGLYLFDGTRARRISGPTFLIISAMVWMDWLPGSRPSSRDSWPFT